MDMWFFDAVFTAISCMIGGFVVLVFAMVAAGMLRMATESSRAKASAEAWQEGLLQGVQDLGFTPWADRSFQGTVDGHEVSLELSDAPPDGGPPLAKLSVPTPRCGLWVTTQELENDVRLGEPDFDLHFWLHLDDEGIPRLTPAVRQALVELVRFGAALELSHGALTVWAPARGASAVRAMAEELVGAVALLSSPATLEGVVATDPSPVLRRRAMAQLQENDPAAARRAAAALLASGDDDLVLRAFACSVVGDDGALAALVETVDEQLRSTALDEGRVPVSGPLVDAIVHLQDPRLMPLAVVLLRVSSETLLRRLLDALGTQGTVAHVPALRALQAKRRAALGPQVERTIDRIQGRSHGEAGAVSMVEVHDAGQLAVAESPEDAVARARPHAAKPTHEA